VGDIADIDCKEIPQYNFLLAGFPCQPFSIAGYQHGFRDLKGRGNLFFEIARILEDTQPDGFLLENVKNLKTHDGKRTFSVIEETLRGLGYTFKAQILNSMDYGNVPQTRERIYIVGFNNPEWANDFRFPECVPLTAKFRDLLDENVSERYYYNDKPLFEKLKDFEIRMGTVYQYRRVYVRENKKGVCPTLTANMGTGGHNVPIIRDRKGIRKMTPMECARFQGFYDIKLPDNLPDSKLYYQIGNSVTVPVVRRIAENIKKVIIGDENVYR
jgi:DNA (cytosine-5)-methyltransferase 1